MIMQKISLKFSIFFEVSISLKSQFQKFTLSSVSSKEQEQQRIEFKKLLLFKIIENPPSEFYWMSTLNEMEIKQLYIDVLVINQNISRKFGLRNVNGFLIF
jgi:hypothetical protein